MSLQSTSLNSQGRISARDAVRVTHNIWCSVSCYCPIQARDAGDLFILDFGILERFSRITDFHGINIPNAKLPWSVADYLRDAFK